MTAAAIVVAAFVSFIGITYAADRLLGDWGDEP